MSDQFLGEIRIFGFNFAPSGWAICAGQLLPIAQNSALFSLLGTQFGGNGVSTFALPDLQGYAPIGQGAGAGLTSFVMGEQAGVANVSLLLSEIPAHAHGIPASSSLTGRSGTPSPTVYLGETSSRGHSVPAYTPTLTSGATMAPTAIGPVGSSHAHNNMPPYLTITCCIAMTGVYPARG